MSWFDRAIFYHMYPLGMVGAERENRRTAPAARFEQLNRYLPYLKVLGCNALYIGPLFESTTHGYDTRDYRLIDRRLGTNEDFQAFVAAAHNYGIRVVVDAVFNHTGREFFAFEDILSRREASAYLDWYRGLHFEGGQLEPEYQCWHGIRELPELNFANPQLRRYLLETVRFWVDSFDIDGLRLDCANVLDLGFQKELRYFTAQMKPDFWLMGEVIHGQYERWVNAETLHSVTNYELHKSLYSSFNSHNFFELAHNVKRLERIGRELYTFAENHDEDRLASKLSCEADIYPAYMALFTLPGKPSIYYGGEFGLAGRRGGPEGDAALRPALSAGGMQPNELTSFIAALAEIHAKNSELHMGEYRELYLQCRQYAFARLDDNSAVITVLNNDDEACVLYPQMPFKDFSLALDLMTEQCLAPEGERLMLRVPPHSGRLIKIKK